MWQKTKNFYHLCIALVANIYFRFPGRKAIVIGITGTDGKTTTVNLIYHILHTAGKRASMVSTVGAIINGKQFPLGFHVTNPASVSLQKFIRGAVTNIQYPTYLVLEVTSHGIDQKRIWGIPFTYTGLTNITHEHLDYHKTYDNYLKTKVSFLKKSRTAVINRDDDSYTQVQKLLIGFKGNIITYGMQQKADITSKEAPYTKLLSGTYNQMNGLLAVAVCKQIGLSDKEIENGIRTFVLPQGRGDIIYNKSFTIMIDFAHTPNGFQQLLSTLRPTVKGRLIHVFGSAGLRDKTKRPKMGNIASEFADILIVTAEDPRNEPIAKITKEILAGISEKRKNKLTILEIPNRQEAVTKAIAIAKKDDFVVITGKGHEKSINYGKGEEPWSDYDAVKEALQQRS